MKITKEEIKAMSPCSPGYEWYLRNFPNNENNIIDIFKKLIDDGKYSYARWFLRFNTKIDLKIKINLAVFGAELVLPIFEKRYPEDNRVKDCIEATKEYLKNKTEETLKILREKRAAAAAADAAAAAAYAAAAAAAYAADAAAYADADAAYAADAAAAYAAAYADAGKNTGEKIINKLEELMGV